MDAIYRRSFGRVPALTGLLIVALFSILLVTSSPIGGGDALAELEVRDLGPELLVWRQEVSPVEPTTPVETDTTSATSSTTSTSTTTTSTSTSTTTTTSTSTSTSTTTRTTPTNTSTSTTTRTRSTSTSTATTTSTSTSTTLSTTTTSTSTSTSTSTVTSTRTSSSETTRGTTLTVQPNFLIPTTSTTTTRISTESESTQTPGAQVGASKSGFWQNKSAVAGVFVVIALLSLGLIALALIALAKRRRNARQKRLHARLFEKYNSDKAESSPGNSVHRSGSQKSGADVVYDDSRFRGATVTSEYPFGGAGFAGGSSSPSPPPAASSSSPTQQQYQYQVPNSATSHESHVTNYYTPNASQQSLSTQQHYGGASIPALMVTSPQRTQYLLPSQAQAAAMSGSAPPTSFRGAPQAGRTSYQPSIDSFYGGNNAGASGSGTYAAY